MSVVYIIYSSEAIDPSFPIEGRHDFTLAHHLAVEEDSKVLLVYPQNSPENEILQMIPKTMGNLSILHSNAKLPVKSKTEKTVKLIKEFIKAVNSDFKIHIFFDPSWQELINKLPISYVDGCYQSTSYPPYTQTQYPNSRTPMLS